MPIVGGLDIHRKQITFDYLDTATGEVRRGQIAPAGTVSIWPRGWRAGSPARTCTSRWRGAPGGGMWRRSWPRPGSPRMSRGGAPPRCGAVSGTPRRIRPIPGTCGSCWPTGGCPSAGSRPRTSWNAGRCWRPTTTCGSSTPPGPSGSTRRCSIRARRSSAGSACAPAGLAALQAIAAQLSRPGSCRSRWPWTSLPRWTAILTSCAAGCWRPPGSWQARGSCTRGCTASGPSPRWRCAAGWAGRAGSPRPARRSGSPGWTSPCTPPTASAPPGTCPGRDPKCCAGASMRPARRTPAARPRTTGTTRGQGPDRRQARRHLRGPQDHPAGGRGPGPSTARWRRRTARTHRRSPRSARRQHRRRHVPGCAHPDHWPLAALLAGHVLQHRLIGRPAAVHHPHQVLAERDAVQLVEPVTGGHRPQPGANRGLGEPRGPRLDRDHLRSVAAAQPGQEPAYVGQRQRIPRQAEHREVGPPQRQRPGIGLHRVRRRALHPQVLQELLRRPDHAMVRAEYRPGHRPPWQYHPLRPAPLIYYRHTRNIAAADNTAATDTPATQNIPHPPSQTALK